MVSIASMCNVRQGCNTQCRGCAHRLLSQQQSLEQKQGFVERVLAFWVEKIHPIVSVSQKKRWGYRTSVTLSAEWKGSAWQFGTKSMDDVIPIHECPVHHPLVNKTVSILSSSLPASNTFPLAFLVLSKAQCTLVVKHKPMSEHSWFNAELYQQLSSIGIEGFWVHYNPSAGRRLFEKGGWVQLYGNKFSIDKLGLAYGPTAFQQQIPKLYLQTLTLSTKFLKPDLNTAVVDLYCGTGTSLTYWLKSGSRAIGVETGAEAVECANRNAPMATVLRGSCRLRVPQLAAWVNENRNDGKRIVLYANPPRTGIETEVLQWIAFYARPERIAYLSCSPGTLSKNISYLTSNGYWVEALYPFDFFPNTYHVECLALLKLQ